MSVTPRLPRPVRRCNLRKQCSSECSSSPSRRESGGRREEYGQYPRCHAGPIICRRMQNTRLISRGSSFLLGRSIRFFFFIVRISRQRLHSEPANSLSLAQLSERFRDQKYSRYCPIFATELDSVEI